MNRPSVREHVITATGELEREVNRRISRTCQDRLYRAWYHNLRPKDRQAIREAIRAQVKRELLRSIVG